MPGDSRAYRPPDGAAGGAIISARRRGTAHARRGGPGAGARYWARRPIGPRRGPTWGAPASPPHVPRAAPVLAVLAAALPSPAPAATGLSSCQAGHYRLVDPSGDPQVVNLQVRMARRAPYSGLPAGAPKCLVAEAVAGLVQARAGGRAPARAAGG